MTRYLIATILIFVFFHLNGQTSVYEMLRTCREFNSSKLNKKNSIVKYYSFNDEESKLKLNINGQEKSAYLALVDTTTWIGNTKRTASLSKADGNLSVSRNVFDKNGLLIESEDLYGGENASMMNEKKIPSFDAKGRLISIRLIKEAMKVDNEFMKITYDDDELFPKEIRIETMMEIYLKRETEGTGYKYVLSTVVPKELMDEVKKELGPNATAEQIKEALGPFGKNIVEYSLITKLPEGNYEDKHFKENDNGKVEQVSRTVFTKDFLLLEKEALMDNSAFLEKHVYDAKGRTIKIERKDNFPLTFEYDTNGNLVREITDSGHITYTYIGSDVVSKATYQGDDLVEYITTEYK